MADIVDTAIANPNFSTLVAAVEAADLVAALKSPGPFTVFAPVNSAFDKLPPGTITTLLQNHAPTGANLDAPCGPWVMVPGRVAGVSPTRIFRGAPLPLILKTALPSRMPPSSPQMSG